MISPRGRSLAIWMAVFTFLNICLLALRFYVLIKAKKRSLRADDFLVLLSFSAMVAMEGTTFWGEFASLTSHLLVSAFWTWTVATAACKLAILCLYLEIFRAHTLFKKVVWGIMACTTIYVPVFIAFFMTQCSPVSAAWDPILSKTNCRPREIHELVSVAVNLALDLAVLLAPLPVIWGLHMRTSKKIGVTTVFSIGIGVVAIMIWRLITTSLPSDNTDLVYDIYILALQSHLEIWLGIIAANIPPLAPLIDRKIASRFIKSIVSISGLSSRKASNRASFVALDSSSYSKKPGQDEFQLLTKGSRPELPDDVILRDLEFRVSVEAAPEPSGSQLGNIRR
ncbi:hypothetical protein F4820DRAFT_454582 [Hypoxylon rubiginosum]|uniref:Uncharacterized protein n=1 Tax=Hypoxylon rubiginosum TaxID=110542 RepID=A0ACB9YIQ7_9PEZI|nr:hypothetical protein F4820DRAFT_454582 [Hypoxylon rubiginosum]